MKDNLTIMKSCEAFLEGHFLLSSGRHSGGYCQCAKLLRFPALSEEVLSTVTEQVKNLPITKVCGPAMGGVIVSYELARQLGVESIFTERKDGEHLPLTPDGADHTPQCQRHRQELPARRTTVAVPEWRR